METNPKKIKKIITYVVYRFECPFCGYNVENPDNSSAYWTEESISEHVKNNGKTLECGFCGNKVSI